MGIKKDVDIVVTYQNVITQAALVWMNAGQTFTKMTGNKVMYFNSSPI